MLWDEDMSLFEKLDIEKINNPKFAVAVNANANPIKMEE
jgi:sulfur carrier protein ThiS